MLLHVSSSPRVYVPSKTVSTKLRTSTSSPFPPPTIPSNSYIPSQSSACSRITVPLTSSTTNASAIPPKDPDLIRILELGLDKVHEHPIYYLFILPLSGYIHFEYLTTTFTDFFTSRSAYPSKALFWAAVFGATAASSSTAYYLSYYYAVPFFVVLPITRFWAEAAEHLGMDMGSRFGHSRNNLGFGHRWYMHPHNDGYHAVHHIHSQVPFYHLPKAHAALMQENEGFRKEVVESWGIGETFWQMVSRKTLVKRTVSETVLGA